MKQIYLVEDHDGALKFWKKARLTGCDLVHFDAHIDFAFHQALPADQVFLQAQSVKELKSRLEYSLAYQRFEKKLERQTDIGNYIYTAMRDGIVRDLYWVIPGTERVFSESVPLVRKILRNLAGRGCGCRARDAAVKVDRGGCRVAARIFGRNFVVCCLASLPDFPGNNILVDIDADFLAVGSILKADNTQSVGKRKLWISPRGLAEVVSRKLVNPRMVTVAYSVNGGFTPIRYRYTADEIAFCLSPGEFSGRYRWSRAAAESFKRFQDGGEKSDYWRAVRLDGNYRCPDNNYGPLYLEKNKITLARKEFAKINSVDPDNPGSLWGLGECALRGRDNLAAGKYFAAALANCRGRVFSQLSPLIIYSLACARFRGGDIAAARVLFERYRRKKPLDPRGYYWLGRICQRQKLLSDAPDFYRDSLQLGYPGLDPVCRMAKIFATVPGKSDIITYARIKAAGLKHAVSRSLKARGLSVSRRCAMGRDRLKLETACVLLRKISARKGGTVHEKAAAA